MLELHSFLRLTNSPLHVRATVFFCLSIHGHLGCFYLLATVGNAAMNSGYLISVLFGVYPEAELLAHIVILCLIFSEIPHYLILFNFFIVFYGYSILLMIINNLISGVLLLS